MENGTTTNESEVFSPSDEALTELLKTRHLFDADDVHEIALLPADRDGITIHAPGQGGQQVPPQVIEVEETLSLQDKEIDMIRKALRKHKGKRKSAARELGISERTLYRKINEYAIEE